MFRPEAHYNISKKTQHTGIHQNQTVKPWHWSQSQDRTSHTICKKIKVSRFPDVRLQRSVDKGGKGFPLAWATSRRQQAQLLGRCKAINATNFYRSRAVIPWGLCKACNALDFAKHSSPLQWNLCKAFNSQKYSSQKELVPRLCFGRTIFSMPPLTLISSYGTNELMLPPSPHTYIYICIYTTKVERPKPKCLRNKKDINTPEDIENCLGQWAMMVHRQIMARCKHSVVRGGRCKVSPNCHAAYLPAVSQA